MDFKGITWAGNIYQKFEAMCLEVEEVMYQDTVKYVENQVQKVGVSVKKFYSEVMQDVLPSSCVDPVKVAAGDLSLNPYAHSDINKKPNSFLLDSPREVKKMKTGDEAISELISEKLSSLPDRNFSDPINPSGVSIESASSELGSVKDKKLGVCRRPIGIRRISRLDRPSKVTTPPTSPPLLGGSKIASDDTRESSAADFGDVSSTSPAEFVERCDPIESSPISEKLTPPAFVTQTSIDLERLSFSDRNLPTDECKVESIGKTVQTPDEGKVIKSESSSSPSCDTHGLESEIEQTFLSNEDIAEMVIITHQEQVDARIEIPDLDETCVLIEANTLDFTPQESKKPKSYKKKIGRVFSSKLRKSKKQEDTSNTDRTVSLSHMESNMKVLSTSDPLESEWELL